MGFIKDQNFCHNVICLLRVIQAFKHNYINGLVLSFDRGWSHLFHCLNKFSLGNNFIRWIRILNGNRWNKANQCLQVATDRHKISLYADDVLILIPHANTSAPALLHIIDLFSNFSGNKINLAKSENVPLGSLNAIPAALPSTPQVVSSRLPVPGHIYNP